VYDPEEVAMGKGLRCYFGIHRWRTVREGGDAYKKCEVCGTTRDMPTRLPVGPQ